MDLMVTADSELATLREVAATRRALVEKVKELLVRRLEVDVDPEKIADDESLFGRGLELDSIDTLELAIAVQEEFEVEVTDDDVEALLSVNHLVDHIVAHSVAGAAA